MSDGSDRRRDSASRILARSGEILTFKRYGMSKDKLAGSQTPVLTDTVQAFAAILSPRESKDRDLRRGDQVLLVEAIPFSGDLTDEWKVVIGGKELPISSPVAAGRTAPTDPAYFFEAILRSGGETIGSSGT